MKIFLTVLVAIGLIAPLAFADSTLENKVETNESTNPITGTKTTTTKSKKKRSGAAGDSESTVTRKTKTSKDGKKVETSVEENNTAESK